MPPMPQAAMLALLLLAAPAALAAGAAPPPPAPRPWFDQRLPRAQRVAALVSAMTPAEKVAQMVVGTPKIERLGVPAYHWRNNILHGTVDNGLSTQFPQSIGVRSPSPSPCAAASPHPAAAAAASRAPAPCSVTGPVHLPHASRAPSTPSRCQRPQP